MKVQYRDDDGYITEVANHKKLEEVILATHQEISKPADQRERTALSCAFRLVDCPEVMGLRCVESCKTCPNHGEENWLDLNFECHSKAKYHSPACYNRTKQYSITGRV